MVFGIGQDAPQRVDSPPVATSNAAANDADYQKYLTDKAAAAKAAEATKMSVGDVLHRLIDAVGWNHTAERDAAHIAITDGTPKDSTPTRTDQNVRQPGETFASDTTGSGAPHPFDGSQRDASGNAFPQRDAADNVIQRDASVPQPFNPNVP